MRYRFSGAVRSVWLTGRSEICVFNDGIFETDDEEVAKLLRAHPSVDELSPAESTTPTRKKSSHRKKKVEETE